MKIRGRKFPRIFPSFTVNKFFGSFSHDIGIDLGTANTLVWVRGKGIVIREPSVVARNKKSKEILAIGSSAKKMLGRAPASLEVVRPLKDGVIADFDAAEVMLKHYVKKVHESGGVIPKIPRPRIVIGIPSGVTEVERRAVADAAISAGAREVHLVEEAMVAAIGAGLPVSKPDGLMMIDIGGGTAEIAVISMGGIVVGRSMRIAGDEMNDAIVKYARLKYSLLLGESTAEEVKISIGTCVSRDKVQKKGKRDRFHTVRGRDLEKGLPKSIKLASSEVREALAPTVHEIIDNIIATLEETPPELVSDIMETGIVLAGGGSLLRGMDTVVNEATKMPVIVADDALTCVTRGCGKVLEDVRLLEQIRVTRGL